MAQKDRQGSRQTSTVVEIIIIVTTIQTFPKLTVTYVNTVTVATINTRSSYSKLVLLTHNFMKCDSSEVYT